LTVYDPVGCMKLSKQQVRFVSKLFQPKYHMTGNEKWSVTYPNCARSLESTALQCGPFICFYAEAILKNWDLQKMPDVKQYRNHIINTILGPCKRCGNLKKNVCSVCFRDVKQNKAQCHFCSTVVHKDCLSMIRFRGNSFSICKAL